MIKKIFTKFINPFILVATLMIPVITVLFPLIKSKQIERKIEKEVLSKSSSYFTPIEVPKLEKPELILTYETPSPQNSSEENPQSVEFSFPMASVSDSTSTMGMKITPGIINLEYIINPINIHKIKFDMEEPKTFLASNLTQELKEKIDFDSNTKIN